MSSFVLGFVVSSALLGCAVGAWFAGPLADRLGRIRVMVIAAALFAISAVGSGLAFSAWELTLWRVLGGLAIGAASVIAPAYIAEVSPAAHPRPAGLAAAARHRLRHLRLAPGRLRVGGGGGRQCERARAVGWQRVALDVRLGAHPGRSSTACWRARSRSRRDTSCESARPARPRRAGPVRRRQCGRLRSTRSSDRWPAAVWSRCALSGPARPALGLLPIVWVGILLSVFQQFVGINVIFYYSTTLWRAVGFSEDEALLDQRHHLGRRTSLTTLVAIALIDRIGRKPLLLIGAAGMVLTLGTMAICFSTATGSGEDAHPEPDRGQDRSRSRQTSTWSRSAVSWGPVVWVLLGRDVQQRHPCHRARGRRRRPVAGQLDHLHHVPGPGRHRARASPTGSTPCSRCSPSCS